MLGIWGALLDGSYDATWVFTGWEGVEANLQGIELNTFFMQDYGVPYGFAPCLLTHPNIFDDDPQLVRDFLAATSEGFKFAAAQPSESADILIKGAKEENGFDIDPKLAHASQNVLSPQYLTQTGAWGLMDPKRWSDYISWLASE